jgi:LCP family protein required for cell wall assembly
MDHESRQARTRKRRRARRRRIAVVVASTLSVLLIAAGAGIYGLYRHLDRNIKTEAIAAIATTPGADTSMSGPQNIVLIGSDSRAGANSSYGANAGYDPASARSDTTILFHLAADRKTATAVSIPRDSMVQIPACTSAATGKPIAAHLGMFNSAFTEGGADCTVKTIEAITGVEVTHAITVDFTGFKKVVDAIGGVQVCLPEAVKDTDSGLDLPAGCQAVSGDQALAYVRARHAFGDGSDIGRIGRQQEFLASALKQVADSGSLTNPVRTYQVLDAVTSAVTTDQGLGSVGKLYSLVSEIKKVPQSAIVYKTVPWESYPADPDRVQFKEPAAAQLFAGLVADRPVAAG